MNNNLLYFFNNIIHITEKTYKPIAFMQPFILVAAAGSLRHVQDMGFKTFNEFWDESYVGSVPTFIIALYFKTSFAISPYE